MTEKEIRVKNLLKNQNNKFQGQRSLNAKEFDEFMERILSCPQHIKDRIGELPKNSTHETCFPSLYKEFVDAAEYKKEYNEIAPFLKRVAKVKDELLDEALEQLEGGKERGTQK